MQGSNDMADILSRRRAATERVGCQKQMEPSAANNPTRWALTVLTCG